MPRGSRSRRSAVVAALAGAAALVSTTAAQASTPPAVGTGPSTSTAPYVLPAAPGVGIASLLTVGDAVGGYRMVGIPDGIGVRSLGRGGVEVLLNHELRDTQGTVRAHGQPGAFVSRWEIDPATGAVTAGSDLVRTVAYWSYAAGDYSGAATAFSRFCSASLTAPGQLFDQRTRTGYPGQVYFANEEGGEGRTFGVTLDGAAWQLPRLGLFGKENTIAAPTTSRTTLVLGNEDTSEGQIWAYWGTKRSTGTPMDRAGLTNGINHVLAVHGVTSDAGFRAAYGTGSPARVGFAEVDWNAGNAEQNAAAAAVGVAFNRVEDGSFDPRHPDDYYFVTTEGGDTTPAEPGVTRDGGGLWRLRFDDVDHPERGGDLTLLLDGSEAPYLSKPDNMTIDDRGNLLIQEDPGANDHLARILAYRIADGALGVLAQFDPAQFTPGSAGYLTNDEESSGIVDVSRLIGRPSTFLFDAQVHAPLPDPELVERGQLLVMTVRSWGRVYATDHS